MSQKEDQQGADRRSFLKLACVGAAATTATVVSGSKDKAEGAELPETAAGYRETDHVRRVYETQRF